MDEAAARNALLVRAWETQEPAPPHWSEEDRAWASRAAAEVEGEHATADALIARRSALTVERLAGREPGLRRVLGAVTWRPLIGWAFALLALATGLLSDAIDAGQRVNILAPPLLAVLAWNLAIYAALSVRGASHLARRLARPPGLLTRALALFTHARASSELIEHSTPPNAAFLRDWMRASAQLTAARVGRVLHVAALAFALGALVGLYLRGLALEYRAGWESTFLDVEHVHAIISALLGPASSLTGIPIADPARLASIRFPSGAGENAASWIHLYGVTVALVVLVPRALLALASRWREVRMARHFPLALDDIYFQRLTRAHRGESAIVQVLPYAIELRPQAALALNAMLTKVFGANAQIKVAATTEFGGEDELAANAMLNQSPALVAALFSLTATPEPENHGVFINAVRRQVPSGTAFVVLIEESAFRQRFGATPQRIDERSAAWNRMLSTVGLKPVFIDLQATDPDAAKRALTAALDRVGTAPIPA